MDLEIPNPETGNEAENSGQKVRNQLQRGMPGPLRREPPLRRQQPVLPRRRDPARQPRASRPAARRRQHADAAPPGHPVRDAGAAEPARARRPDRWRSRSSRRARLGHQPARAGAEARGHHRRPRNDYVHNVLPQVASENAAYQRRERRGSLEAGRPADDDRDPKAPRRLPGDRRRDRRSASAIGAYILSNQRLRFPLVEEPFYTVKAELPDAQAVTPGQGQTVRRGGRARRRHRHGRPRGRQGGRRARARAEVQGPDHRRGHGAAARQDRARRTCSSRSTRATASRSPRTAASRSRTRRPTSTRTSSSPRSTATRATT